MSFMFSCCGTAVSLWVEKTAASGLATGSSWFFTLVLILVLVSMFFVLSLVLVVLLLLLCSVLLLTVGLQDRRSPAVGSCVGHDVSCQLALVRSDTSLF